jgi:DNA polymerase III epsilon subunit-like protein
MPARFIGIDCEMTGLKGPHVHQLIQIGVAISAEEVFSSDLGYDDWNEDPDAMRANGFTAERIRAAPRPSEVDRQVVTWLGPALRATPKG